MGLFDTIHLTSPIRVPGWKAPVEQFQTKHFGCTLQEYTVGSLLSESPVLLGIVEEHLWGGSEQTGGKGETHVVYLAVWHHILAGVYLDADEAERRLQSVDRLDLIAWLDEAERAARYWKNRQHELFTDVKEWHERQDLTIEKTQWDFLRWHLSEEILTSPDPLGAILESHRKDDPNLG